MGRVSRKFMGWVLSEVPLAGGSRMVWIFNRLCLRESIMGFRRSINELSFTNGSISPL